MRVLCVCVCGCVCVCHRLAAHTHPKAYESKRICVCVCVWFWGGAQVGGLDPLVRLCASSVHDGVLAAAAAAVANLAYNDANRKRIAQLTVLYHHHEYY